MQIGRLFSISMLSVAGLAVLLGAEVLVPQYQTVESKGEAIRAVEAFGAVLIVGQNIAGMRAPYVGPLSQETAATPAQQAVMRAAGKSSDDAFEKARGAVNALSDRAAVVDGLNKAATSIAATRDAADRVTSVAVAARDPAIVKGFLPGVSAAIGIVEPLLNRIENKVVAADASLTALLNIARTAQDLRLSGGGRAAILSIPLGAGRAMTIGELSALDRSQ